MRRAVAAALVAVVALGGGAGAQTAPVEKPFPAGNRSVILREEKVVYTVEGTVRIPRGVEVSCQKDIVIRRKGKEPAVIEVEGSFKAHGVAGREILFEGVTVRPATTFQKIHLDSCRFRDGGGLATAKESTATGDLFVQLVKFETATEVDLSLPGPSLDFVDSTFGGTLRLRAAAADGKPGRLKATFRGADLEGIEATGVADLTFRINRLGKGPAIFRDCAKLIFDGNFVASSELRIEQTRAGCFGKTQFMKCDLYSKVLVFRAPADPALSDGLVLDKCWFEGITDRKAIEGRIRDAADDPANNVKVRIQNPMERPHELAGGLVR